MYLHRNAITANSVIFNSALITGYKIANTTTTCIICWFHDCCLMSSQKRITRVIEQQLMTNWRLLIIYEQNCRCC